MTVPAPLRPPIGLLLFDLDGVLCDFHAARRADYLATLTGRDAAWIQQAVWGGRFEQEAEAGGFITGDAYLAETNRLLQFPLTRAQWVEARRRAMVVRPTMLSLLRSLSPRVRLAVLTNNGSLLRDTLPELAPELHALLGDRLHVSCDLGARKPDPAVFERVLVRHGVPAVETAFVDDSAANVAGARTAGLQAHRFESLAGLCEWLAPALGPLDASRFA